jgi:serpin B
MTATPRALRSSAAGVFALAALVATMTASCGSDSTSADGPALRSSLQRELQPSLEAGALDKVLAGNTAFAVDLYKQRATGTGNLFMSPYSLSLALAMTYAGAQGTTADEMAATLHFTQPQEQLHPAFDTLDLALQSRGQPGTSADFRLRVANSLWLDQSLKVQVQAPFLDTLARSYGAGLYLADFAGDGEGTRQRINEWVSGKTEQRIPEVLADPLSPLAVFAIVNALYFKASWEQQFAGQIASKAFHAPGGDVRTAMIYDQFEDPLPYATGDGWQALELRYAGGEAGLVVLLPDEGRFDEIEQALTADLLGDVMVRLSPTKVAVTLPKFEIRDGFDAATALRAMGMSAAFDADTADFSGIDGQRNLSLLKVIHQAWIKLDEKGTEAAAATVVIGGADAGLPQPPDVTFTADRPFIFFIRDIQTRSVLFLGRFVQPQ